MLRFGLILARESNALSYSGDATTPGTMQARNAQAKDGDVRRSPPLGDIDSREEKLLEKLVFGGETELIEALGSKPSQATKKKKLKRKHLHSESTCDDKASHSDHGSFHDSGEPAETTRKPAWDDEDDHQILNLRKKKEEKSQSRSYLEGPSTNYADHLKTKFLTVVGTAKWADLNHQAASHSGEESDDDLLRRSGNLLRKSDSLPRNIIQIQKCQDLNREAKDVTAIKCTEFHRGAQVAAVAGFSGTLSIFEVNGETNPMMHSIRFDNFPIHTAHFTIDGTEIIVGSRQHGHFFYYDMIVGKVVKVPWDKAMEQMNFGNFYMSPDGKIMALLGRFGYIHIMTSKTKELITSLKMNGNACAIAFNKDGTRMFSHGDCGEVYVWDMNARQCIHKFYDEGCISGTSLAVSPNGQYLAAGSRSGIVNVYNTSVLSHGKNPKPLHAVMNLTTEITSLKFNISSEVLAMASFLKKNALKLVHFPSMTAYSNFPLPRFHLHYVHCVDFSPNSGYLSLGNGKGVAHLFRMKHYSSY